VIVRVASAALYVFVMCSVKEPVTPPVQTFVMPRRPGHWNVSSPGGPKRSRSCVPCVGSWPAVPAETILLYGFVSELVEWQITTLSAAALRAPAAPFKKLGRRRPLVWRSSQKSPGWLTAAWWTVDLLFWATDPPSEVEAFASDETPANATNAATSTAITQATKTPLRSDLSPPQVDESLSTLLPLMRTPSPSIARTTSAPGGAISPHG